MTAAVAEYLEWDTQNWSVALDFWKQHSSQNLGGSRALEIGARHGGLSMWLAHQGADVVCSDLGGPSERAVARHQRGGVTGRITYADVDATKIPYDGQFDVVVFKSVLGSVGRAGGRDAQATAVREMYKAIRPGGELFFAENLTSSPLHRYARRRFVKWGARWRYVSIDDMRDFLAPFSHVCFKTLGFAAVFGRSPRWRRALGSLDRLCLSSIVPPAWRYIIVGLARK